MKVNYKSLYQELKFYLVYKFNFNDLYLGECCILMHFSKASYLATNTFFLHQQRWGFRARWVCHP